MIKRFITLHTNMKTLHVLVHTHSYISIQIKNRRYHIWIEMKGEKRKAGNCLLANYFLLDSSTPTALRNLLTTDSFTSLSKVCRSFATLNTPKGICAAAELA